MIIRILVVTAIAEAIAIAYFGWYNPTIDIREKIVLEKEYANTITGLSDNELNDRFTGVFGIPNVTKGCGIVCQDTCEDTNRIDTP